MISSIVQILTFIQIFLYLEVATDCTISINKDLKEPQPLLLKIGGSDYDAFVLPEDNKGTISFEEGDALELACPGGTLLLDGDDISLTTAEASCVSASIFRIHGRDVTFKSISCTSYPATTARYNEKKCGRKFKEIEVGFQLESRFLRLMISCFDHISQSVKYVQFNLTKTIAGSQKGFPRNNWMEGDFYSPGNYKLNNLYSKRQQRNTINRILGLNRNSNKYIKDNNGLFLARGHLTAKTDFVYGSQQRATLYYINAAPQWQVFNAGNWMRLEQSVRKYASNEGVDLVVYTGTYGLATLHHQKTGRYEQLSLYPNDGIAAIEIPQLYWKVVYEPISRAGIVFIGVNNPYDSKERNIICPDVSDRVHFYYFSDNAYNPKKGYMYACTVPEFRKIVKYLPPFRAPYLLV